LKQRTQHTTLSDHARLPSVVRQVLMDVGSNINIDRIICKMN